MAKTDQLLIIEPQYELKFKGPFTNPVTSYMKISNPTDQKICFKVKTTAPKKYCVRPNSGVLDPGKTVEVAVSLQPFDFDSNERKKHKFMVQSLVAPDEDVNIENLWKDAPQESLMNSKLKCVFEMPDDPAASTPTRMNEYSTASQIDHPQKSAVSQTMASAVNGLGNEDLLTAIKEVKQLREEVSSVRQENFTLKEELAKLRSQPHTATLIPPKPANEMDLAIINGGFSVLHLALALFMVLLGIIVGKYVF